MKYVLAIFAMMIVGCTTAHKINKVSLGMTKEEVVKAMGNPVSTSAAEGVEYMNYSLFETNEEASRSIGRPYFVRIVGGKVDAYGRLGDFDSTKEKSTKIEIEHKSPTKP